MTRLLLLLLTFGIALSGVEAVSAAPVWQPPVEVASGWISGPVVVAGSLGGVAVGWEEVQGGDCNQSSQDGCGLVRVAVRRADGTFFPPVTLNAPGRGSADMLRLAVTAGGDVLAAWHQSDIKYWPDPHTSAYYVAVGSARTGRFGRARRVGEYSWSGLEPLTLTTNRRGDAALAWPDMTPERQGRVRALIRPADGEWSRPVTVAETAMMHPPGLALADDGRLLVLWADRTERRGDVAVRARVRAPGGRLSPEDHLHTARMEVNSAWSNDLTPAWTPAGERVAFWRSGTTSCPDDCGGTITAYAAWASAGRFSKPQALSSHPAGLQLVADATGRATAGWVEYKGVEDGQAQTEIRLAQRPAGGSFSDPISLFPGASGIELAALGRNLFLSWHAPPEGGGWDLLGSVNPDDPGRTTTTKIAGPIDQSVADVASTPARELLAAWLRYDGTDTHVLLTSGPDDSSRPAVSRLRVSRRVAARGRHRLVFRFNLSEPAEVELRLRRARGERSLTLGGEWFEAGEREIAVSAKHVGELPAGRYVAVMRASDRAGDSGRSRALSFRVVTR